jgi:hypothetical protein
MGHSEENTLMAGKDDSGNKNGIQAIGSTVTYLQRYTLKAALGLAAGADDDGAKSDGEPELVSPEQMHVILDLIADTNTDVSKFCEVNKIEAVADLPMAKFNEAVRMLRTKKARLTQNGVE